METVVVVGLALQLHDPFADSDAVKQACGIALQAWESLRRSDIILCALAHRPYRDMRFDEWRSALKETGVIVDFKSLFDRDLYMKHAAHIRKF